MPRIKKLTIVNGSKHHIPEFNDVYVADVEHFKLDYIYYLQNFRGRDKVEIDLTVKDFPADGGVMHQNEVENF